MSIMIGGKPKKKSTPTKIKGVDSKESTSNSIKVEEEKKPRGRKKKED